MKKTIKIIVQNVGRIGFLFLFYVTPLLAQLDYAPEMHQPDKRFKSDVLLVVAHPDDETAIGSYLAKMVFDENRTISVVYSNRGNGGGNSIGREQSTSMGLIRETEVRRALANFGIFNVWFLDGLDTPGQDVLKSLKNLNHGSALEKLIRIVRLTRPEVIITWLPQYSSGENHGDHQAAGVIATEAFDMAGDPTLFPTQIVMPRESIDIDNFNEGLKVWQAKKIYYFSDREVPIVAEGPSFDVTEISKTKNKPFLQIATSLMKEHLVQADVAGIAFEADKTGDYEDLETWMKKFNLIFGKSHVECSKTGDVFEGIDDRILEYQPPLYEKYFLPEGISFELGGLFFYYKEFWKRHNIEHIAKMVDHEVSVSVGSIIHFPLKINNNTDNEIVVTVRLEKPEGWEDYAGSGIYKIASNDVYEREAFVSVPYNSEGKHVVLNWKLFLDGKEIDNIKVGTDVFEWVLPQ